MDNLNEKEKACIGKLLATMKANRSARWTGKLEIEINYSQGGVSTMYLNTREMVVGENKRKVRSSGI